MKKVSVDKGVVASYIHAGGKIGVLVVLETEAKGDAVAECGRNVAMQVAALKPKYVDRSEVSEEFLAHPRN